MDQQKQRTRVQGDQEDRREIPGGVKPISDARGIVILTGAGISRESGLATFRDPDGLWAKVRIEDVIKRHQEPSRWRH